MGMWSPKKITTMEEARKHRTYALVILVIVYAFNFLDRRILTILQTPIKEEFNLGDGDLGLLTGFLFAVVYTTIGIPVARIADATNRKNVMNISLAVWSGFTAISGLAQNFWQLALARMGVGVGEAGGSPPAHAMISDLYEPDKRARALAVYSAGLYIGTLVGYVAGGWLSDAFDWRVAFFVVGVPGILLALLIQFTLREPLKGLSGLKPSTERVTFVQSFKHLWSLKSFRFFSFATGAGTFVTYGIGDWMVPFMERSHGLTRAEIGFTYGVVAGVCGFVGTIGGGIVADWLGKDDKRWQLWVPMWGKLLGGPIFVLGLLSGNWVIALACYGVGLIMAAAYLGPSLAVTHSLVPPGMRAMSSAVLFLILNMIGLGLGPFLVGLMSDLFNTAAACPVMDPAVQAAQACPSVKAITQAMLQSGDLAPKTLLSADAIAAAEAAGFSVGSLAEGAGFGGQLAYGLRGLIPGIGSLGVNEDSLRWAMIACVVLTYPFCILWHWGAQALPRGTDGKATNHAAPESVGH